MVCLWDVIEHLPDPKAALPEIRKLLKPDGVLLINYPDIGTWQARLAGRRFWWILSVHLHHFTRKTITEICRRTGFEALHFRRYWQTLEFGYLERMAVHYKIPLAGQITRLTPDFIHRIPIPYYASQTTALARIARGPHLGNALISLGIYEETRQAVAQLGLDVNDLLRQEEEPGLGNGGLGRLAACIMDSLSTLEVPAIGYGIRYEFGIFDQVIRDGHQVEITDKWLRYGNPWELARPEIAYDIGLEGHSERYHDQAGHLRVRWVPGRLVKGVAYDTPVLGYRVNTTNLLRLWKAEAAESFDFEAFNVGDYFGAVDEKIRSETITNVLYPNDEPYQGKELRLAQ